MTSVKMKKKSKTEVTTGTIIQKKRSKQKIGSNRNMFSKVEPMYTNAEYYYLGTSSPVDVSVDR